MFLVNSRLGLFSATSSCSNCYCLHINEVPLLPRLRGHFAEFLNEGSLARLRILTPPTCVGLRYGHQLTLLEVFLDSMGSATSVLVFPPHHLLGFYAGRICLSGALRAWTRFSNRALGLPSCVTPSYSGYWWHRIFNRFSIAYAFRPRLRSRLTLGGRAFPRNP